MKTKTDNAAYVGTHVFSRSKLGLPPFRCIGVYQDVGPKTLSDGSQVGSAGQSMGVCDHCGTGIRDCYQIKSSDGKSFVVGSSCVEKTGDAGLIQSYKNSPEVRAFLKAKRDLLNANKKEELANLIEANRERLSGMMKSKFGLLSQTESQLEYLTRVIPMCGAAGRARYLKHVKGLLA